MNFYPAIFKFLLESKEHWKKFNHTLDRAFLKANHPEYDTLLHVIQHLYESGPDERSSGISQDELWLALNTLYPRISADLYGVLVTSIYAAEASNLTIIRYLRALKTRASATELARRALAVSDGVDPPEALYEAIREFGEDEAAADAATEDPEEFVTEDLASLATIEQEAVGLHWRLGSLNRALGPLRKGNFGFLFARPETGKTTFLASELSHMAQQPAEGPILFFNNEEDGKEKLWRIYEATLGKTKQDLLADVATNNQKIQQLLNGNIKMVDDPTINKRRIEELCTQYSPRLIVFDQIDKIKGFQADRSDLELASIYRWARELAKQHAPVIGVCQAGATGDGRKWLTMNDVDNSKTGKQAEADWILGIGKTYDAGLENVRFLHLSKNKLSGGQNPDMRHGRWEVKIVPEVARYVDFEQ